MTVEERKDAAARLLFHYLNVIAKRNGTALDSDCRAEIREAVDYIVDAAVVESQVRAGA
jgi:hypothetical protein